MNDQLIIVQAIKKAKACLLAGVVIIIVGMGAVGGALMAQSTGLICVAAILPAFGIIITAYGSLMTWWHQS
jgi:hypothetical protein